MSLISWNCRGLGKASTLNRLRKLISQFHPSIFFLQETKCSSSRSISFCSKLSFKNFWVVDSVGLKGGLLLFWDDNVTLSVLSSCQNWIFCKVIMKNGYNFLLSCVYGPPKLQDRVEFWNQLRDFNPQNDPLDNYRGF